MKRLQYLYNPPALPYSAQKTLDKVLQTQNFLVQQNLSQGLQTGALIGATSGAITTGLRTACTMALLNLTAPGGWTAFLTTEALVSVASTAAYTTVALSLMGALTVGLSSAAITYGTYRYYYPKPIEQTQKSVKDIFTFVFPFLKSFELSFQEICCVDIYKYVIQNFSHQKPSHQLLYSAYSLFLKETLTEEILPHLINSVLPQDFPYEMFWSEFKTLTACEDDDYLKGDYCFILSDNDEELFIVQKGFFLKFILKRPSIEYSDINIDSYYKYNISEKRFVFRESIQDAFANCQLLQNAHAYTSNFSFVIVHYFFRDLPDALLKIIIAIQNNSCRQIEQKLIEPEELSRMNDFLETFFEGNRLSRKSISEIFHLFEETDAEQTLEKKLYLLHSLSILFVALSSKRFLGTSIQSSLCLRNLGKILLESMKFVQNEPLPQTMEDLIDYLEINYCSAIIADELFISYPKSKVAMDILQAVIPQSWWSGDVLNFS